MEFRRSGQRDERRRRVLIDDADGADEFSEDSPTDPQSERHRYSTAALAIHQPPMTCVIPKRLWLVMGLLVLGIGAVAGVEWLFASVYVLLPAEEQAPLAALDVSARGSLADWLASSLLMLAGATSLMIFALRRFKLDDYRGKYRMWLWVSFAFVLGSIDVATRLHEMIEPLMQQATGVSIGAGSGWTLWVVTGVVSLFLIRLSVEMWRSRSAIALLVIAASGLAAFVLLQVGVVTVADELMRQVAVSACWLGGHLAVASTIIFYCRYVYLESQGKIAKQQDQGDEAIPTTPESRQEKKRASSPKKTESKKSRERSVRVDAAHEQPSPSSPDTAPAFGESDPVEPASLDADDAPKLSKAERRRLRKQARRQQRAR